MARADSERGLEMRAYGYRSIAKELQRRGMIVNHKRVLRLRRQDNLLCLRRQAFVRTTDSNHSLPVYPNLARGLVLSNINHSGSQTLLTSDCGASLFISRSSSTLTVGAASAGPFRVTSTRN